MHYIKPPVILTIDDEYAVRKSFRNFLEDYDFEVLEAENGLVGLELFEKKSPDLVLLDIIMPEMDGYETCRKIKKLPGSKDIPIIFLTAMIENDEVVKGFEFGAVDYITKPFNPHELLARIDNHLKLKFTQATMLQQKNELKELLQILCHDLSNPLGAVISSLEVAAFDPDYIQQNLDMILSYARRQYEIIELVRSLRGDDHENARLELATVNVLSALGESLDTLNYKLIEKNIQPVLTVQADIHVIAEKTSLVNSVFNNLLTNAIKFSYPGSKIIIDARYKGRHAEITITDEGVGIPEEMLKTLFEIDSTSTRFGTNGEKGTGFGMPLVKKFVTAYGGNIETRSKEKNEASFGHGTQIKITLDKPVSYPGDISEV